MSEILIAYTTNSGSTLEVAQVIADEFVQKGNNVSVKMISEIDDIKSFDSILVGAPMILGWHNAAKRFLRKNKKILAKKKCAYFCTAVSITKYGEEQGSGIPVFIDPFTAKAPVNPEKMTTREKYALPEHYILPILKQAPEVKPISIALFGGNLDMGKLNFLQMVFVMAIIRAQPGDYRNWESIRQWANSLNL